MTATTSISISENWQKSAFFIWPNCYYCFLIINGPDNSLYSFHKFKKIIRKKQKLFTCFQLLPSKMVYGEKYLFFKCWLKVNQQILQVPEHRKTQLWLIFNENVKLFVFFLFWHQNGSWPPPFSPLIYVRICQTFLRPTLHTAVWRHMWTIPKYSWFHETLNYLNLWGCCIYSHFTIIYLILNLKGLGYLYLL